MYTNIWEHSSIYMGSQTLLDLRILRCVLKYVHQGPDPRGCDFSGSLGVEPRHEDVLKVPR